MFATTPLLPCTDYGSGRDSVASELVVSVCRGRGWETISMSLLSVVASLSVESSLGEESISTSLLSLVTSLSVESSLGEESISTSLLSLVTSLSVESGLGGGNNNYVTVKSLNVTVRVCQGLYVGA